MLLLLTGHQSSGWFQNANGFANKKNCVLSKYSNVKSAWCRVGVFLSQVVWEGCHPLQWGVWWCQRCFKLVKELPCPARVVWGLVRPRQSLLLPFVSPQQANASRLPTVHSTLATINFRTFPAEIFSILLTVNCPATHNVNPISEQSVSINARLYPSAGHQSVGVPAQTRLRLHSKRSQPCSSSRLHHVASILECPLLWM